MFNPPEVTNFLHITIVHTRVNVKSLVICDSAVVPTSKHCTDYYGADSCDVQSMQ